MAPARPNLLLIMCDQLRADALGCSGGWVRTPNIDRLAAQGVRFANCVTTSPVCVPARMSMATGTYPHNNGVWTNARFGLREDDWTWMRAVREAGYRTSLFGKTHLHPHHGDLRDRLHLMHAWGLDDVDEIGGPRASARLRSNMTDLWEKRGYWEKYQADYAERFGNKPWVVRPSVLPLELYADVYVGRQASRYLRDYDRDEPWFCWVSFGGPHEPWDTPELYASRYDPKDMPLPVPRPAPNPDRPQGALDARLAPGGQNVSPEEALELRADYAGNVTLIDDQVGEIMQAIEARGELDNTVIVFTSDHGEHNGDYGLIYKETFLDGAVRVPMIVRTPATAQRGGAVSDALVEWFDAGATLVECAGGDLPGRQLARSLMPVIDHPTARHRDEAISEVAGEIMMLTDAWKMALNTRGKTYLLFNVQDDPDETRNLAGRAEVADVEASLRQRLLERLVRTQLADS